MKRRIYSPSLVEKFRQYYINQHSKFIFISPLKLEDLDKEFSISQRDFKIVGMNDDGLIVLYEKAKDYHYIDTLDGVHKNMIKVITE